MLKTSPKDTAAYIESDKVPAPIKYTIEKIETIASRLKALPPIEPKKKEVNKGEAIGMLTKEISELQRKGYSLENIKDALKAEGIDVSLVTLKSYLAKKRASAKVPAKAPAPAAEAVQINTVLVEEKKFPKGTFVPTPDTEEI